MKKVYIQIVIMCCILIEAFILMKIMQTSNFMIENFLICIAIIVMLILLKLINHLTNVTYGKEEKNKSN
jgi:hypothetical protein